MPNLAVTPELSVGTCDRCGSPDVTVYRFFVEAVDGGGFTPFVCNACLQKGCALNAEVEEPQKHKPKPISKHRRRLVDRQEQQMADLIGGRKQKASGALAYAKSDVRLKGSLRGEMKSTIHKSFSITRDILDKIRGECQGLEKPFVQIRFLNPRTLAPEDDWVVIPLEDWSANATRHPG